MRRSTLSEPIEWSGKSLRPSLSQLLGTIGCTKIANLIYHVLLVVFVDVNCVDTLALPSAVPNN